MINKNILQEQLMNKFHLLSLHAIVNECFIGGLPFEKDIIEKSESKELTKYSLAVLESLGGYSLLKKAMESAIDDKKKKLLTDIIMICNEATVVATKRIIDETDVKNVDSSKDIVDTSAFTKEEYDSFAKKVDSLDTDDISKLIQEKTKTVIQDEQAAYEKDEQIEAELKDALASSKSLANESYDSYADIVLSKSDARHHTSLFAKLQEAAYENLLRYPVGTVDIEFKVINTVTFESFLDVFKTEKKDIMVCLEAMVNASKAMEYDSTDGQEDKSKLSTLVSIIVYTMMETLKTMNLFNPDRADVAKFVGTAASAKVLTTDTTKAFTTQCCEMLDKMQSMNHSTTDSNTLSSAVVELTKIQELLSTIVVNNNSFLNTRMDILDQLANIITRINATLDGRNEASKIGTESLGYYAKRDHESDVAQLNKIHNLFAGNANIKEVQILVNPATEASFFDVHAVDATNHIVGETFITLNTKVEKENLYAYVQESFSNSKLATGNKSVAIYCQDGKGNKIVLR